jgi:hypothetical protein
MTVSRQNLIQGFLRGARAFRRKYSGNHAPEPLGKHANFVINFCQILFEPKTRKLQ